MRPRRAADAGCGDPAAITVLGLAIAGQALMSTGIITLRLG